MRQLSANPPPNQETLLAGTLLKASRAAEGIDERFRRGEGSKTVAAYAHDDLLEKRRPVMQAWSDFIRPPGG